jgi:hypothetical protein
MESMTAVEPELRRVYGAYPTGVTAVAGLAGAEPLFLEANAEYVVDIHRGWTTEGAGKVDTTWALVWHFTP